MKHWIVVCAALALAAGAPAGASTFLEVSHEELVEKADAIVQGRVIDVASFWNRQGTVIMTEAVVEVEDTILGRDRSHVRVVTFGGTVGDYRIVAEGFPTFEKGQRVLVFLEPARRGEDGAQRVLGYRQGEFDIRQDKEGREIAVAAWEADTVHIVRKDGTEAQAPRAMVLSELKSWIRETAARMGRPDAERPAAK
jgi:hypothetical protein